MQDFFFYPTTEGFFLGAATRLLRVVDSHAWRKLLGTMCIAQCRFRLWVYVEPEPAALFAQGVGYSCHPAFPARRSCCSVEIWRWMRWIHSPPTAGFLVDHTCALLSPTVQDPGDSLSGLWVGTSQCGGLCSSHTDKHRPHLQSKATNINTWPVEACWSFTVLVVFCQ